MSRETTLMLKVLSPEGNILEVNNLISVNIPLADGSPIGIKPGHAPLIAETEEGAVFFYGPQKEDNIKLQAGLLEIRDNLITILTSGEISTTSPEMTQTSNIKYDRLMKTLIEDSGVNEDS